MSPFWSWMLILGTCGAAVFGALKAARWAADDKMDQRWLENRWLEDHRG